MIISTKLLPATARKPRRVSATIRGYKDTYTVVTNYDDGVDTIPLDAHTRAAQAVKELVCMKENRFCSGRFVCHIGPHGGGYVFAEFEGKERLVKL